MKEINTNFKKLEADVSIVIVNNLLMKKPVDIERQCWANAQYSRRECLEIAWIPTTIPEQRLEEKVCQYLKLQAFQLIKRILTTVIDFETRNERLLSFFDATTASVFYVKNNCEAWTSVILICQRESNCSYMKAHVLAIRVFESFVNNCGTGSEYIPILLLMIL